MAITVESRAIHISNELADIFVTSTHADNDDGGIEAGQLVASAIDTPPWATIRRSDVHAFWESLPDHIRSDFAPKDSASKERMWLEDDQQFVLRALDVQLEGHNWTLPSGFLDFGDRDTQPFIRAVEYYRRVRRDRDSRFAALAEFSPRMVPLYAWTLARFHDVDFGLTSEGRAELLSYELPASHSPGLDGITLKELTSKGAKTACLLPLIAGAYGGVEHLLASRLVLALQVAGTGAGMTLFAVSALWLADKLFSSMKQAYTNGVRVKRQARRPGH